MPSALVLSPPLVHVPRSPGTQVPLALALPLVESTADKHRALWVELFRHVALLEMCLAKEVQLAAAGPNASADALKVNGDKIAQLREKLDTLALTSARLLDGAPSVRDAFVFHGFADVFPLFTSGNTSAAAGKFDLRSSTVLNQVVSMALQLRNDVALPNHKYMAHQIALLYQSLTSSREDLRKYRAQIEGQFDAFKAACSAQVPEPQLLPEQRQWLTSLTTDILTEALFTGRNIVPSQRAVEFLRSFPPASPITHWTSEKQCPLLNNYRPIRVVGRGAHGIATLAEPVASPSTTVVVKQVFTETGPDAADHGGSSESMSPSDQAKAEVQILAMLQHPNIIRFLDSASYYSDHDAQGRRAPQQCWVLVMEHANGGNLHEFLKSQAPTGLDALTVQSFTGQLVLALHYIHSQHILHRDLKSHNVLLHRRPRPPPTDEAAPAWHASQWTLKLADFGIAKLFIGSAVSTSTVIGTPNYLSPELCQGEPYDEKADIWALGCILFELATAGEMMFDAPNLLALTRKITERIPTRAVPDSALPVLHSLIPQLTALDRARRLSVAAIVDLPEFQPCLVAASMHSVV
ncbi:Serine/threonine-protein kinase Nek9 [Blastocladiella emersonii ATCC 22665]|nr:Serine/threonine-protein kinase Nek9 [Blastocladiella emersonii ATCC 22665]